MASKPETSVVNATESEKSGTYQPAQKANKPGAILPDKSEQRGETLPGWTIMRPLRMRGLKGKGSSSTAGTSNANVSTNATRTDVKDRKDNGELKVTETNGSGDGSHGIGEVEALSEVRSDDGLLEDGSNRGASQENGRTQRGENGSGADEGSNNSREYKVYKRRWFGLVQLVLLNIIVSWDWLSFSANSTTASQYYDVSPTAINWLSTGFLFAFVIVSPLVLWSLHHGGPKPAIITASLLILLGNWIRYGATRSGKHGSFGGVMFGQVLTGLAQPFVLSAPTRYSDMWFTNRGRVAATAIMSLANPFGGALAQLIDPMLASKAEHIPNMVLYIAIISTVATVPSFFIPAHPPTPASASGHTPKQPLLPSIKFLLKSPEFYMILIPFWFYVGLFNSISSLINQLLQPYSFTEDEAGIAGALLIVVGLVTSAVTSPIIDKTKSFLIAIKIQVPLIALSYLAFTWAPQTRNVGAPYAILAILGAASFSLVPVVLEYLVELTHPVSPEVTSTICWTGGQLLGGIFIVASDAMRAPGSNDGTADDHTTRPPGNMYKALILQTVLALVVVPLPLALGCCGRSREVRHRRVEADKEAQERRDIESGVLTSQ